MNRNRHTLLRCVAALVIGLFTEMFVEGAEPDKVTATASQRAHLRSGEEEDAPSER